MRVTADFIANNRCSPDLPHGKGRLSLLAATTVQLYNNKLLSNKNATIPTCLHSPTLPLFGGGAGGRPKASSFGELGRPTAVGGTRSQATTVTTEAMTSPNDQQGSHTSLSTMYA